MTDDLDQEPSRVAEAENDTGLDELLDFIHRGRGFDFTGHKRTSLTRRIRRRMEVVGIDTFAAYLDHLEVHPDEFPQLFDMLLINVTGFFRDSQAWEALAARIPSIVDVKGDCPIRVWSAGCSSGEEPYSLAMLMAEALGVDAVAKRVKIYATDVDEAALAHARQAVYTPRAVEAVAPALVEKYFISSGSSFVVKKELRRAVIFGRHDLVHDAPIPRIDIITCRNSLMYFNAETQTRILQRLHFALAPTGILFLGKAEMLLAHPEMFFPIDLKLRLFGRAPKDLRLEKLSFDVRGSASSAADDSRVRLVQNAFAVSPIAQIVIDVHGKLTHTNNRANHLFGLGGGDIGRTFHDLDLACRPVELRASLDKVRLERRTVQLKEVEHVHARGERASLDIEVAPLVSQAGAYLGTELSFIEVTHAQLPEGNLRRAKSELESAQEELKSTSDELVTTNEELQSTVEELETTNEELQAANEELQSTNEELQTINEELRQSGSELNEVNAFYSSVLGSFRAGVAVLDRELRVLTWNTRMEGLWGSCAGEVEGKHFLNLDIGLPIDRLTPSLRACLAMGEQSDLTLECTTRRGKSVMCRISVMPLRGDPGKGLILVVEEVRA